MTYNMMLPSRSLRDDITPATAREHIKAIQEARRRLEQDLCDAKRRLRAALLVEFQRHESRKR